MRGSSTSVTLISERRRLGSRGVVGAGGVWWHRWLWGLRGRWWSLQASRRGVRVWGGCGTGMEQVWGGRWGQPQGKTSGGWRAACVTISKPWDDLPRSRVQFRLKNATFVGRNFL